MALLDKFNDWYNKTVPDNTGPVIGWMEPVDGTRYRWKQNARSRWWMLGVMWLILLVPWPGKNGRPPIPFPERIVVMTLAVGFMATLSWAFSFTRTRVAVAKGRVWVGAGRSTTRLNFNQSTEFHLEKIGTWRTILIPQANGKRFRIFLSPQSEAEVVRFLRQEARVSEIEAQ